MTTRRQLTLHLDDAVARALEHEAARRGLTLSRAANAALGRALVDEDAPALADTVKARLDRLDQRQHASAREMALLRETLLAFIRLWLAYAGPPDTDEDEDDVDRRFDAFLDEVVKGVTLG
jgi:hypothetical protein